MSEWQKGIAKVLYKALLIVCSLYLVVIDKPILGLILLIWTVIA